MSPFCTPGTACRMHGVCLLQRRRERRPRCQNVVHGGADADPHLNVLHVDAVRFEADGVGQKVERERDVLSRRLLGRKARNGLARHQLEQVAQVRAIAKVLLKRRHRPAALLEHKVGPAGVDLAPRMRKRRTVEISPSASRFAGWPGTSAAAGQGCTFSTVDSSAWLPSSAARDALRRLAAECIAPLDCLPPRASRSWSLTSCVGCAIHRQRSDVVQTVSTVTSHRGRPRPPPPRTPLPTRSERSMPFGGASSSPPEATKTSQQQLMGRQTRRRGRAEDEEDNRHWLAERKKRWGRRGRGWTRRSGGRRRATTSPTVEENTSGRTTADQRQNTADQRQNRMNTGRTVAEEWQNWIESGERRQKWVDSGRIAAENRG